MNSAKFSAAQCLTRLPFLWQFRENRSQRRNCIQKSALHQNQTYSTLFNTYGFNARIFHQSPRLRVTFAKQSQGISLLLSEVAERSKMPMKPRHSANFLNLKFSRHYFPSRTQRLQISRLLQCLKFTRRSGKALQRHTGLGWKEGEGGGKRGRRGAAGRGRARMGGV